MKKIATATLAALMTATPALADNSYDAHVGLWNTLQRAGVTTQINPRDCKPEFHGYYNRRSVKLVVCQDNSTGGGRQVEWTANDLDTLRHEAQHVLQDCMVGGLGDLRSSTSKRHESMMFPFSVAEPPNASALCRTSWQCQEAYDSGLEPP